MARDILPDAERVATEYLTAASGDPTAALAMAAAEIAHLSGMVSAGYARARVISDPAPERPASPA